MSRIDWNGRVQRAQWIDDAETLKRFARWHGPGFEKDIAQQVRGAGEAKRARRLARKKP